MDADHVLIVEVPRQRHHRVGAEWEEPSPKTQRTEAIDSRKMTELVTVAQQLGGADERKVGTVLKTSTEIFGTNFSKGLYIRQEYWDVHEIIQKRLTSDHSIRRVLVVGSPGIGKSVFGVFMFLLCMTEHKDVAYRPLDERLIYFTHTEGGYVSTLCPLPGKSYYAFFDGNEAGGALSLGSSDCTFLFASPRTTNYNQFVKEMCFKVYMNPWTRAECQALANTMNLEDPDEWFWRFNLVGGKPRLLFSSTTTIDCLRREQDNSHQC